MWWIFFLLLLWKFYCTISFHQWISFLSPHPLLLNSKYFPTGTLFPQLRCYISHQLVSPLSSIIWDLKYLVFSSFPKEGVLWNAFIHSLPLCSRLLSEFIFHCDHFASCPHRAFSQHVTSQPVPIQSCVTVWGECVWNVTASQVFSSAACIVCLVPSVNIHIANKDLLGHSILR